jgi:Cu(I)/Ag(I) efflux system protein CusF
MKRSVLVLLAASLLAACSSPQDDAAPSERVATPPAVEARTADAPGAGAPAPPAGQLASASGVVESVDAAAKKITIAHGAVESLKWPAMTMSFHAPNADLTMLKAGDRVIFEFASSGMDGTITKIERQP